jgi:hypothetical protein
MSDTYFSIPTKQISTNFGTLNKVIWFDVTDINGTFNVNLYIAPNQTNDVKLTIFNKGSKEEMYNKTYNKSSDSTAINESVKLTHIVGQRTVTYGIKSL